MQVRVNDDCIGCGLCANICPEVFTMTDDGVSQAVGDADQNSNGVLESAEACPVNAIEVD